MLASSTVITCIHHLISYSFVFMLFRPIKTLSLRTSLLPLKQMNIKFYWILNLMAIMKEVHSNKLQFLLVRITHRFLFKDIFSDGMKTVTFHLSFYFKPKRRSNEGRATTKSTYFFISFVTFTSCTANSNTTMGNHS